MKLRFSRLAIAALLAAWPAVAAIASERVAALREATPSTPANEVIATLAAVTAADDAEGTIASLLHENAPLFAGRVPNEVTRMRAAMFAALAATSVPDEALPLVAGELAHGHKHLVLAAAARAAATAGRRAHAAVPHLIRLLSPAFHDDAVSLADLTVTWSARETTTVKLEAIRALEAIGSASADALPLLREVSASTASAINARAAARAIAAIETPAVPHCHTAAETPALTFISPWLARTERKIALAFTGADHDGAPIAAERLAGKPFALTFFYTRCENDRKCSLTMSHFARLRAAAEAKLGDKVRFAAMTFDPDFDTPSRMVAFARARGYEPSPAAAMIRPADLERVVSDLGVAASFSNGRPNVHAVQLFLFDREGRFVREYRNVAWNDADVIRDLERLSAE